MTDCDMCGKQDIVPKKVMVEGTAMTVCANCARYGSELVDQSKRDNNFSRKKRSYSNPDENLFVVDNYTTLIKQAREKRKQTQAELAKELREKESLLHSIESGHKRPSIPLARKIQKMLRIRLLEEVNTHVPVAQSTEDSPSLTMEEKVLQALKKSKE